MKPHEYPQIRSLEEIYQIHKVEISVSFDRFLAGNKDYPAVVLSLDNQSFLLFVDDEYKDLQKSNPILSFCVVLRELETYQYAKDYSAWCVEHSFDVANAQIKDYYTRLEKIYITVKNILGNIDSQISDYDFGLNAGAARKLRETSIS